MTRIAMVGAVATSLAVTGAARAAEPASTDTQPPRVLGSVAASGDSFGISRIATRGVLSFALPYDLGLAVGGGPELLSQGTGGLKNVVAGADATWSIWRIRAAGGAAAYETSGTGTLDAPASTLGDYHLRLSIRPADFFQVTIGGRHRPFLEMADALATDESAFHGAGAGGAESLAAVRTLEADDWSLTLGASTSFMYFYADAHLVEVYDTNADRSLATGTGINLLAPFAPLPVDLYARYDLYMAGYDRNVPAYYSPPFYDSHSAGGEARWRIVDWLRVATEGGRTFAVFETAPAGWFAGGSLGVARGPVTATVRGQIRQDVYFEWRRLWVGLTLSL